jgi:fibronectin type 3 domain-containing protein
MQISFKRSPIHFATFALYTAFTVALQIAIVSTGFAQSASPKASASRKISLKDFRVFATWSPKGAVVGLSPVALSSDGRSDTVAALVLRKGANDKDFVQIARVERAPTKEAAKAIAGEAAWELFLQTSGAKNDDDAWRIIREDRRRAAAALFIPFPSIGAALGMAYIDSSSRTAPDGTRFTYAVRYVLRGGTTVPVEPASGVAVTTGQTYRSAPPRFVDALEADSTVALRFQMEHASEQELRLAAVFRQIDGLGAFEQLPLFISPTKKTELNGNPDVAFITFDDRVEPEHLIRYYVQLQDGVGNLGARSDTATVISLTQSAIPRITTASAKDTPNGIMLQWKVLKPKPYFLGVQISRAEGPESPYMPLDTVSLFDSTYLDQTVVSGKSYFYGIKALLLRPTLEQPAVWVSAAHRNATKAPVQVYGVEAAWEEPLRETSKSKTVTRSSNQGGIRLRWEKSIEQDIANYLVYRAPAGKPLEVVSQPLPPNVTAYFDADTTLSGNTTYIYAIRAVNFTGMESINSSLIRIRPQKPVTVRPPNGFGVYEEYGLAKLQWSIEAVQERPIIAYQAYKRLVDSSVDEIKENQRNNSQRLSAQVFLAPAEENALKVGFKPLFKQPIQSIFATDTTVKSGEIYEYAVSAIDADGNESGLSAVVRFSASAEEVLPPSKIYVREVEKGVEISWSKQMHKLSKGVAIYRRSDQESTVKRIGIVDVDENSFIDTNVQTNMLYFYSLRNVSEGKKESSFGLEASIRVP